MFNYTELPADYRATPVSESSLKALDVVAAIAICVMTLGPLAVTAYQNPYTGKISATPNVPGK